MTLQAMLDQQAIDMLPRIKAIIQQAPDFEKNQIINKTLRECMTSIKPLDQMNKGDIFRFEMRLISLFKFHEWIK